MYQLYKTKTDKYFWYLPSSKLHFAADNDPVEAYMLILRRGVVPDLVSTSDTLLAEVRSLSELRQSFPEYLL